jgi:hypothetical protein
MQAGGEASVYVPWIVDGASAAERKATGSGRLGEISNGSNASIRHAAGTEVPTLQKHLTLSRAALKASPGA